jgi:hypothetical protein
VREKLVEVALAIVGAVLVVLLATVMLLVDAEFPGARAEANAVTFPPIEEFEHYTTVERGVSTENLMTSREALAPLKRGAPVPVGTHMVLVDY